MTGTFITIEGIEGAGKSTIAKRLIEWLENQGRECLHTREPGGTQAGEKIREILLNPQIKLAPETELLLFEAARRQIMEEQILPALQAGKTVVLDRFYDSTTAYQGYGRGLDLDWIEKLNLFACHGRKPDLTILLDIDVRIGLQRARKVSGTDDRFESEKVDFMQRIHDEYQFLLFDLSKESKSAGFMEQVRQGFLQIAEKDKERILVVKINEDADKIWSNLQKKLKVRLK